MKTFHFYQVYEMASLVDKLAKDSSFFIEMPWEDLQVIESLVKPSKISLLHRYIYVSMQVNLTKRYRKDNDSIEEEDIAELEEAFGSYGIKVRTFSDLYPEIELNDYSNELGEAFFQWFESESEAFQILWEYLTEEVFHLLFANRTFLLSFNASLAEYLEGGEVKISGKYLNEAGKLKRCEYLPSWLKKAVYFRDRGRCVFCQKDLSGLLSTDRRLHYDHIVPLYRWGTNDPSNFQLLCESCNLSKSKKVGITSNHYSSWWQ